MKNTVLPPHGGCGLINRMLPDFEKEHMLAHLKDAPVYHISDADLSIFYRIADGALSPLTGPMCSDEFNQVLEKEVIVRNGTGYAWTIPIAFPVSGKDAKNFAAGQTVIVKNSDGEPIGTLDVKDIYKFDKAAYNKSVYGTDRKDHPGARIFNDDPRDFLLGGDIWAFSYDSHPDFGKYMLTPAQTRALFEKKQWDKIVAFQTRNALHRAHEYALLWAAEKLTRDGHFTGAVLNPLVGATKSDDVPADVRMHTYEALMESGDFGKGDYDQDVWKKAGYSFADNFVLVGLDMKMFYAGPKEAIMHAIYRQNYGFTNIVIGRKHADAPFDDGEAIWGDFDAHEKFDTLAGNLEIEPVKVGFAAYFEEIEQVGLIAEYKPKGYHTVFISGKEVRKKLHNNEEVDNRIMRTVVSDILRKFYAGNDGKASGMKSSNVTWHHTKITKKLREERSGHKGVVLWLTGLSGSGKSTIATIVEEKLFDMGCRAYILDGDNIRHGLNGDLGFSPEDREENIRRIGEVARLFADAGHIAITSFISPYRKDRDRARSLNNAGEFVEVFIKAPVSVCEDRDPKGLYKKARQGIIKEFTGISAPYEEPENAELVIETHTMEPEQAADAIIAYLKKNKIIQA